MQHKHRFLVPHGLGGLAATVSALLLSGSFAATWIVDQGGGGHATTIQGGVDLAAPNDEVLIRAGTYGEQINLNKPLALRGESGRDHTIVDAEDSRPYCLNSTADISGSLIEGITFTGVNGGYGFCVGQAALVINGGATVSACAIVGNICDRAPVLVSGNVTFLATDFLQNTGMGWHCGQTDPDHGSGCVNVMGSLTAIGCLFEGNVASDNAILDVTGVADIRNSVFRGNASGWGGMFVSQYGSGQVRLEGNLFVDNPDGRLFGNTIYGGGTPVLVEVLRNTFARNPALFVEDDPLILGGSVFHANVFSGSEVGLRLPAGGSVLATCNDSWGNEVDWVGFDPAPGDNFSLPPIYCDPEADDFTVASNSPLLAPGNPCGEPVGAFGMGCGAISLEAQTWGRVKSLYR